MKYAYAFVLALVTQQAVAQAPTPAAAPFPTLAQQQPQPPRLKLPTPSYEQCVQDMYAAARADDMSAMDAVLTTAQDNSYTTIVTELVKLGWADRVRRTKEAPPVASYPSLGEPTAEQRQEAFAEAMRKPVGAVTLVSAYQTNEIAADNAFKGDYLRVTGHVEEISKTFGTAFVTLDGGEDTYSNVIASFEAENEMPLASLVPGQLVTIDGTCAGLSLVSVSLKDCKLAATPVVYQQPVRLTPQPQQYVAPQVPGGSSTAYIVPGEKYYHSSRWCKNVAKKTYQQTTKAVAVGARYRPCGTCKP